jgi:hypothetical protein
MVSIVYVYPRCFKDDETWLDFRWSFIGSMNYRRVSHFSK